VLLAKVVAGKWGFAVENGFKTRNYSGGFGRVMMNALCFAA